MHFSAVTFDSFLCHSMFFIEKNSLRPKKKKIKKVETGVIRNSVWLLRISDDSFRIQIKCVFRPLHISAIQYDINVPLFALSDTIDSRFYNQTGILSQFLCIWYDIAANKCLFDSVADFCSNTRSQTLHLKYKQCTISTRVISKFRHTQKKKCA